MLYLSNLYNRKLEIIACKKKMVQKNVTDGRHRRKIILPGKKISNKLDLCWQSIFLVDRCVLIIPKGGTVC